MEDEDQPQTSLQHHLQHQRYVHQAADSFDHDLFAEELEKRQMDEEDPEDFHSNYRIVRHKQGVLHPAEKVDRACRIFFPMGFLVCNAFYWMYYLYIVD